MKKFSIENDKAIEKTGGFFCSACLVGRWEHEQSPDPRYCGICYEVLMVEASRLTRKNRRKTAWVPVPGQVKAFSDVAEHVTKLPANGKPCALSTKHPGGRPIKEGEVSRMTVWRRKKAAEQQEMVLV